MGSISGRWKRGNGSVPPDKEEMPFILKDVAGLKHLLFPAAAAVQMCAACLELEFRRAICVSAHLLPSSVSVARRRLGFKVGAPPTFLVLNPEMTQFSARSWVELKEKPRLTRREEEKKKKKAPRVCSDAGGAWKSHRCGPGLQTRLFLLSLLLSVGVKNKHLLVVLIQ